MGLIKVFIIEQFIEQLYRDGVIKKTDLEKCLGFFKRTSATFAKATEINAPFIKIEPSEFFNVEKQEAFDFAWNSSVDFLSKTIGKRDAFIVLDDVDSYFVGIEKHPRFVEGLCRAIIEINRLSYTAYCC